MANRPINHNAFHSDSGGVAGAVGWKRVYAGEEAGIFIYFILYIPEQTQNSNTPCGRDDAQQRDLSRRSKNELICADG